jgi:hypothetical protein
MRFSIRDLLWATLVVAIGLGWWVHSRATKSRHHAAIHEYEIKLIVERLKVAAYDKRERQAAAAKKWEADAKADGGKLIRFPDLHFD